MLVSDRDVAWGTMGLFSGVDLTVGLDGWRKLYISLTYPQTFVIKISKIYLLGWQQGTELIALYKYPTDPS